MKIDLSKTNLAINGGQPIRTDPWKDNFTTGNEERAAVSRVFDSGYLSLFEGSHTPDKPFSFSGGPEVQNLENEWCEYYSCEHSISMNSATSGLYAAIGALGIGFGDEVIVSPYTMTACAIAPLIYGAIPVFADVDIETGSLDPVSVEKKITSKTKAILLVHQFGMPADMKSIMEIAKSYGIKVIEDCAQAHAAKYNDQYVGTIGDIGVFSLNVNKSIQAGEGGVCVTNSKDLAYRLKLIRNHGESVVGPAGYKDIMNIAGFNYRLSEIHAAIAREQLKKLDGLNSIRLELIEELSSGLKNYPFLSIPSNNEISQSTYYVYPLKFLESETNIDRGQFVEAINKEGCCFFQGYVKPLYLQPIYQNKMLYKHGYPFTAIENRECYVNYDKGLCPNAEELHFKRMIINEHIRYPHNSKDIKDILNSIHKVVS